MILTDYSKNVLNNPEILREKLGIFLHSQNRNLISVYANACEKFFAVGGRQSLKFCFTWSWNIFFFSWLWAFFRKQYLAGFLFLVACYPWITLIGFSSPIAAMCGKFLVCRSFVIALNMQNDDKLKDIGGINPYMYEFLNRNNI